TLLVRVEHHVNAIRHVVRIHRHTLKVVRSVNTDSNLSVLSSTQRNIVNAATKLNDTIHVRSAFFSVTNTNTIETDVFWRSHCFEASTTVFGISRNRLDLLLVVHNVR